MRETVPDSIFDRADAIELVDLTPDDLIQRLKEGKVYIPKQAERALEHFFSPANLTALRELALRRTAERVDEQLLTEMQARAIPGPWAAGERILVCVSEDPRAAGLVRYHQAPGGPAARALDGALYRDPRSLQLTRGAARPHRRHAAAGAGAGRRAGDNPGGDRRIADDVIAYAQANNVTQIVIGKSTRSRWFEMLHGSVVHDLVRRSGNISVHVIAGEDIAGEPIPKKTVRTAERQPLDLATLSSRAACGCRGLGVSSVIRPWLGIENVDLVFLTAVVGDCRALSGFGRRCSPASLRRFATISFSCRRSTPSRLPIRPMSRRFSSLS